MEENKNLVLNIDIRNLPEYKGAKAKQEQLIESYPFVEITDNKTYDQAKRHRTALRQGRFDLQNGEKAIVTKLNTFKGFVKDETTTLIAITLDHEQKQQAEVERYEAEKRREKEETERVERERIEKIKNIIIDFRKQSVLNISEATLETIEDVKAEIRDASFEVDEFAEDIDEAKEYLIGIADEKKEKLEETERLRLENEKLEAERKKLEEERKAEEARLDEERKKIEEERKAEEEKQRKIQEEAEAKRKEEKEKLAKEREEIEAEKERIRKEEEERQAKIKEEEEQKAKEIEFRNSLIDKAIKLTGKPKMYIEQFSNEKLQEEIARMTELKENERLQALKSDKEKAVDTVNSLQLQDFSSEIKDEGLKGILETFKAKVESIQNETISNIENY